mgnify:CR=1 FL=1
MTDVFPEVGQVVLTSLLSLAAMFIFTCAGGKRQAADCADEPVRLPERRHGGFHRRRAGDES